MSCDARKEDERAMETYSRLELRAKIVAELVQLVKQSGRFIGLTYRPAEDLQVCSACLVDQVEWEGDPQQYGTCFRDWAEAKCRALTLEDPLESMRCDPCGRSMREWAELL